MESGSNKLEKCKNKLRRYSLSLEGYEESISDLHANPRTRMAAAKDYFEAAAESMWKMMKFYSSELFLDEDPRSPKEAIELFAEEGNINKELEEVCYNIVSLRNRTSHEYDSETVTLENYYTESLSYIDSLNALEVIFEELYKTYKNKFE